MPLPKVIKSGQSAWRAVAGDNSGLEQWVKRKYLDYIGSQVKKEKGSGWVQWSGDTFMVVSESEDLPGPRRGVILHGGCDLPSMYQSAPHIREGIEGTIAIAKVSSGGGRHRADEIMQTLNDIPPEQTQEVRDHLRLKLDYFQPILFEKSFEIPRHPEFGEFPNSVVVLSIASDLTRVAYQHREHGFLVDPGGWWLNDRMEAVLDDLDVVNWFRSEFKSVGRISVDDFEKHFTDFVRELRARVGADVIMYNSLVVEPKNETHNYQLVRNAHSMRRRQFEIALAERSRDLDFPVLDVDWILKREGVNEQIDFAHFPVERMGPIGREAGRILRELGVA